MTPRAASRVLAILHASAEPLGALEAPLVDAGIDVDTRLASDGLPPSIDGYAGLIVMGGPMGVYDADRFPHLRVELDLLREALGRGQPVLGICLGSQLLAAAAGGRVFRGSTPEVGWLPVWRLADDPWLSGWPSALEPLHLHGDTFDLPPGSRLLASSVAYPHQAFRIGSGLGLQFHVEATAEMARDWLTDGLPAGWRLPVGHVERRESAAALTLPLAVGLARAFAHTALRHPPGAPAAR